MCNRYEDEIDGFKYAEVTKCQEDLGRLIPFGCSL